LETGARVGSNLYSIKY